MELNETQFGDANPLRFRYHPFNSTYHQMSVSAKIPTLLSDGQYYPMLERIGEIAWNKKTGVAKIAIHPEYRRQGVGTALWQAATEYAVKFKHIPPSASASTTRTDAGDAFLKKIDPNAGKRKKKATDDFGDYWK